MLDVGSGFGTTTLELARAVGEQGRVMALDVSEPLMARLRSRTAAEAVSNIISHVGDAQTEVLPAEHFRLVVSRFGVMFFDDPTAAFANIHEALRPDGRLVFVCWQPLAVNEWVAAPLDAMAPVDRADRPSPPPGGPGPFGLATQEVLHEVLDGAGFSDVELTSIERPVVMGGDEGLDAAVEHCAGDRSRSAGRSPASNPSNRRPPSSCCASTWTTRLAGRPGELRGRRVAGQGPAVNQLRS